MNVLDAIAGSASTWTQPMRESEIEHLPLEPWDPDARVPSAAAGGIYVLRRRYLRTSEQVAAVFAELADQWEQETFLIASPREAAMHPAYQRIIGLGLQAVPLLLHRLRETRRGWFWALAAITHENPADGLDSVGRAIDAWMDWGTTNGYLELEH